MPNQKSILHVVNIFFVIPYFLGEQLTFFQNKGYKIHIVCSPSNELYDYISKHKFEYKAIPILRKISLIQDIKSIVSICKFIKTKKIDIIVGHTPKGGLLAMFAGWIMNVPIRIYFRHGIVYETSKGLKRFLLVSMDKFASLMALKIVCVSPSVYTQSIKDKLNPERKQMILSKGTCNGIDVTRFKKTNIDADVIDKLKIQYNIRENDFIIGYVGRLVRDKGIVELVEAFEIVLEQFSNVKLLLIGMFEERDKLPLSIVEKIKTHPQIINTDYINNDIIENYYALMDIFVLPSYREGFPTSILEASSMQIPVITTKATGCIDALIENVTGIFVEHQSSDIAKGVIEFIKNEDKRIDYGIAGRKFVVDNFEQHIIWNEIEKLYK
jgi:glycosyltransferase involved in cell wall biosynthesis